MLLRCRPRRDHQRRRPLLAISQAQKNKPSHKRSRVVLQTINMICCKRWFVRACFVSTWTMELLRRDSHLLPMVKRCRRRRKVAANGWKITVPAVLAREVASVELLATLWWDLALPAALGRAARRSL